MKAIEGQERLEEKHDELAISFECSKNMVLFWEREVKRREELLGIAMLSRICSGELQSWIRAVVLRAGAKMRSCAVWLGPIEVTTSK